MPGGAMSRYDDTDGAGRQETRRGKRNGKGKGKGNAGADSTAGVSGQASRSGNAEISGKAGVSGKAGRSGKRKHSLGMRIAGGMAIALTCTLVAGALYAYEKYGVAWDDINRVDVSQDLQAATRPPQYGDALNLLMIGSDTRSGENGKIGGADPGARSDTVMVVHISPGRHSVVVLSFPRDSVVPVLQCAPEDGTTGQQAEPGQVEQLNSTFAYGGPGCLWHTIEQTTHIRINDFLELTFVGFEKVINGIGGVNVCLPYSVDDPMSGLHLPAGRHHIYGSQALAFWRTREDLGQGSDLQRIERDQLLMVALLHGIEKNNLLKNKTKMLDVLTNTARADAITMDSGMTTGKVLEIAQSLDGLSPKSVQFVEVPVVTYPLNDNWVQWAPQDNGLFAAIAHNSKLPKAAPKKPGTAPVLDSVSPASVKVEVLNGTETGGLAGTTGTGLSSAGFDVLGESDADNADYTSSVIEYRTAAALPAARTLEARLGDVILRKTSTVPRGTIDLIIGSSFTGLKSASKTPAQNVSNLSKAFGGITGSANICHNSAAFSS
jgi:LCP family protein required for cell wall assembly